MNPEADEGTCGRCGAPTRTRFGDRWICENCYAAVSSCCPEFGADDPTGGKDVEVGKSGDLRIEEDTASTGCPGV